MSTLHWSSVLFRGKPDFRRYGFIYIVHIPYYTSGSNSNYKHQPYKAELLPHTDHCWLKSREPALVLDCRKVISLVTVWRLESSLTMTESATQALLLSEGRQAGTNQECQSQTANTLSHHGIHFLVLLIMPNWVARGAWSITEYLLCNFGCLQSLHCYFKAKFGDL